MKRSMKLVREILETAENSPAMSISTRPQSVDDAIITDYHILLLVDAGYLKGGTDRFRLTWAGHDYLDALRAGSGERKYDSL